MTIFATKRHMPRCLPGHIITPEGSGREPETIAIPHVMQVLSLAFGGTAPLVAGNYTTTFATPQAGSVAITINSDGTKTFAAATLELAAAIAAQGNLGTLAIVTNNGTTTTTLTARSSTVSLALPVVSVPGATTLTPLIVRAASSPTLRIGLFYTYGLLSNFGPVGAVMGGPRGVRIGTLPTSTTTVAQLRGVVARTYNQTSPASNATVDAGLPNAYRAGSIGYGCLRGEVGVVVDPNSATITDLQSEIHVVIVAGAYTTVGAIASVADGVNTLRLDSVARARMTMMEETVTFGQNIVRCAVIKVNQTC